MRKTGHKLILAELELEQGAAQAFTESLNDPRSLCCPHCIAVQTIPSKLANLHRWTEMKVKRD